VVGFSSGFSALTEGREGCRNSNTEIEFGRYFFLKNGLRLNLYL